jgi:hypothetical protein
VADRPEPPIAPAMPNRRALILPGGGMRVAYQAGAVKALHDWGLRYSHADAASGGTMNLAALLSGIGPDDLCRRWRTLDPKNFVSLMPFSAYLRFPNIAAFGSFQGLTRKVFPHLGIDTGRLRAERSLSATFNVCVFDEKIVTPLPNDAMDEPLLLAGVSLPLMTPAVRHDGHTYTDAVWIRDCNLMAPVKAGANELWIIWCIANTPVFKNGPLNQYVHMIEMSALGALHEDFARIAELNERISRGERPYGHDTPIVVHLIRPDWPIPLDPDYVLGRTDGDTLVDTGYRDASRYLASMTHAGTALDPASTRMREPGRGVAFREAMSGRIAFGQTDPLTGARDANGVPLVLRAAIDIRDIDAFVADQSHTGEMVGHVYSPRLGGILPSTGAAFRLFSPSGDPAMTEMVYEMGFKSDGRQYWLAGRKTVRIGLPFRAWRDTTTLFVTLHEGGDKSAPVVAAGVLSLGVFDLARLLATFRATGCEGVAQRLRAIVKFGGFFVRELWRTYIRRKPVSRPS